MSELLIKKSEEAHKNAYAPFSKMHIGAALQTLSGTIYLGCNVENSSYGLTSCAERNAIFAAVQAEGPAMRIAHIAISSRSGLPITPCGACRQVIAEFSVLEGDKTRVSFPSETGYSTNTIDQLLPHLFRINKS